MPRLARSLAASLLLATMLSLTACATGPLVRTDADPTANFAQYRTWGFYRPIAMEQSGYSSWVSERIKEDVRREMEARGYRYAQEGASLLVNFHADVQDRTSVWSVPRTDVQWVYSYRARTYVAVPFWYDETMANTYREAVLTVDLVDAAQNRMVWTGSASAPEARQRTPEQKLASIDAAVGGIFARYPHRAAQ
ncbi:DUF4136 domain-containing protein [Thermomonas sp.]|uniref:DUF4136 domain-containing protein n=1 Tax=Thermomonas sp. TaxID=1971895 RepID=UPI00263705AA|nr:DUF4136 domain-containing protein [Thermomonas sp.]